MYEIAASDPKVVAGELEQIDKAALRRAKWREVAQARTLEQLQAIGKARGYHPLWPSHIMREREAKRAKIDALAQGGDMFR